MNGYNNYMSDNRYLSYDKKTTRQHDKKQRHEWFYNGKKSFINNKILLNNTLYFLFSDVFSLLFDKHIFINILLKYKKITEA